MRRIGASTPSRARRAASNSRNGSSERSAAGPVEERSSFRRPPVPGTLASAWSRSPAAANGTRVPAAYPTTRSWVPRWRLHSSASRRVFPDPGNPEINAAAGLLSDFAAEQTDSRTASSTRRPMKVALIAESHHQPSPAGSSWFRGKDSNLRSRIQSPLPYLLATPDRAKTVARDLWPAAGVGSCNEEQLPCRAAFPGGCLRRLSVSRRTVCRQRNSDRSGGGDSVRASRAGPARLRPVQDDALGRGRDDLHLRAGDGDEHQDGLRRPLLDRTPRRHLQS